LSLRWLIKGNEVECMSSGLDRKKKRKKNTKKKTAIRSFGANSPIVT